MSNGWKIILGILSVVPILSLVLLLLAFAMLEVGNWMAEDDGLESAVIGLTAIRPYARFMWIGLALALILVVVFSVLAFRDNSLGEDEKSQWVILLILLNYIVFPLFWYKLIWKHQPDYSLPTDRPY